ncbi:hypothetical protein HELRODRAFT_168879 [Helobdella robusta]|uniref:RRM domain-containing protein n=1 Tax=Helobdella robusta TaxID=6412 RepID=T1F133_HELRO|nr:hypothetical protein HELRODRAFT_168879 [Helobdella robusta]ESO08957.1 hypothetical protein HELRODRAFT_168879 [Helobdella robusta]
MDCSDKVIVASDLGNLLSMFEQVGPLIESVNSSSSHVFIDNKNIDITSSNDNNITSIADAVALPADINIASPPNDSLLHSITSFDTTSNFNVVANYNDEVAIFQHDLAYDDVCVDECVIYDFETETGGDFSRLDASLQPENTVNDDQSCLNDSFDEIYLLNCKNSSHVDDINADNHINNERVVIACDVTDITEAADINSRHHSNSRHRHFEGSFMNSDEDDDDDLLPCHARHQQQLQQNQRSQQDVMKLQQDPTQEQHLAPSQPQMQTMAPLSPQSCNFGRGIESAIRLKKGGRFQGRGRSCCLNNNNDAIIDNNNINNNHNNNNNDDATKPTVNNHNNFTDKSSIRRQQYNTLRRKCSSSNSSNNNNVTRRQNYQKKSEQEPVNVNIHQNYYYNNIFEDDAEDGSQKYIDKIPTYYTALSRPTRGIVRNIRINISDLDFPEDDDGSSLMCVDDNILLDKIPAYHSCFTNSTKYDVNDLSVNNNNNYINNNNNNYIINNNNNYINNNNNYINNNNNYINNNRCIYSNSYGNHDFTFTSGPDYDSYNNDNNNNSYNDITCNDCDESSNNNNNNNNNKMDRKIVHIGRIPRSWSTDKLKKMFEEYGPIVEYGHKLPGCERLDICLGGRRKFCRQDYTDLDGNMQVKEEFVPGVLKSEKSFEELLREATKNR